MNRVTSTFENEIERYGYLIYTNVGDSMMPLIRNGKDLLLIRKKENGKLKKYDIVLYKRDDGQYVLHRILKVRKADYVMCGDNRWKKETGITDKHIIGILKEIIRDGKVIKLNDKKCILYEHIWCDMFFIRLIILKFRSLTRKVKRVIKYYG